MDDDGAIEVRVKKGTTSKVLRTAPGSNLRNLLLEADLSPYKAAFQSLHCRGLGICGSCGILVKEQGAFWKRRACQIRCFQDLEIEIQ